LRFPVLNAARIIREGGVVAYPTEGVFGLGCHPLDAFAAQRILYIKQRDPSLGLILIAANREQLEPWIRTDHPLDSSLEKPITWVVPASPSTPVWIRGKHKGVAVRITQHPIAADLCRASRSAIISTSANVSGRRPAANAYTLRRQFRDLVDSIVPGRCGPSTGPSEIRDLTTGTILRMATT